MSHKDGSQRVKVKFLDVDFILTRRLDYIIFTFGLSLFND